MRKDILPGQLFLFTSASQPDQPSNHTPSLKYVGATGLGLMKTDEAIALSEALKASKALEAFQLPHFQAMYESIEAIHAERMLSPGKIIPNASFSEVFGRTKLYVLAEIIKKNIGDNRLPQLLARIVQELNKAPKK